MRSRLYAGNERMMLRLSSAKSFAKPLQIQRNQEAITVASLILAGSAGTAFVCAAQQVRVNDLTLLTADYCRSSGRRCRR